MMKGNRVTLAEGAYREMMYTERTRDVTLLYRSSYKGYEFCCVSHGSHPCAYVALSKGQPYYNAVDYEEVCDLECHGGCTFINKGYWNQFDESYTVIGWDYAHAGDFCTSFSSERWSTRRTIRSFLNASSKKWTTEEIVQECYKVIDQLYLRECPKLFYK